MADLTTLLSKFLADLYAGTAGTTVPLTSVAITGPGSGATITNPSTNNLTVSGSFTTTSDINVAAANFLGFSGRSYFNSPLNGQLVLGNAASTSGVGFDVLTDGTFKVRSRAIADTAIVDVSRYSAGGTLGVVTFGPAAVASITVKGGIITAIS